MQINKSKAVLNYAHSFFTVLVHMLLLRLLVCRQTIGADNSENWPIAEHNSWDAIN